ncbi:MAG: DUF5115 domain-containing protein [Bacteroides sp.]|nr:DUF5115 domain-containing protein [Bacteroides sp.]
MKKISIYVCALCSLAAFTACNEDFKDWADPQSNPQEASKSVTASLDGMDSILDMNEYDSDSIDVAKWGSISDGCTFVDYKLQLSANGETVDLPSNITNGVIKVDAAELSLLTEKAFNSRQGVERSVAIKNQISILTESGEGIVIEGTDIPMTVTPVTPPAAESAYYLVGAPNGWTLNKDYPMEAVEGEEGVFTITIEMGEGDYFKFFPESAIDAGDWGPGLGSDNRDDDSTSGLLGFYKGTESNGLKMGSKGKKVITINVKDYTYTIKNWTALPEEMYINGSAYSSDWNWTDAVQMVPVTQTAGMFWSMQYYEAGEQIKFAPVRDWKGDFGWNDEGVTAAAKTLAELTEEGGNIRIGKTGWYIVVVTADEEGNKTIDFLEPKVYMLGGVINESWICDENTLFTNPTDDKGDFVSPAITKDGTARICVVVESGNWWKSEFTISDGKIVYRENKEVSDNLGELGYECKVTAGQKVHVNFANGTGSVE